MDIMDHFSFPFKGMKDGIHHLKFEVEDFFFEHYPNNMIDNGSFEVDLRLEKKPGVGEMLFEIKGHAEYPCDRCLDDIGVPVQGSYKMLLKYGKGIDTEEVIYIDYNAPSVSVAALIYDFIVLSIPMTKTCEMSIHKDRVCNDDVLLKIDETREETHDGNVTWDALKGLKFED